MVVKKLNWFSLIEKYKRKNKRRKKTITGGKIETAVLAAVQNNPHI